MVTLHLMRLLSMPRLWTLDLDVFRVVPSYTATCSQVIGYANTLIKLRIIISTTTAAPISISPDVFSLNGRRMSGLWNHRILLVQTMGMHENPEDGPVYHASIFKVHKICGMY